MGSVSSPPQLSLLPSLPTHPESIPSELDTSNSLTGRASFPTKCTSFSLSMSPGPAGPGAGGGPRSEHYQKLRRLYDAACPSEADLFLVRAPAVPPDPAPPLEPLLAPS